MFQVNIETSLMMHALRRAAASILLAATVTVSASAPVLAAPAGHSIRVGMDVNPPVVGQSTRAAAFSDLASRLGTPPQATMVYYRKGDFPVHLGGLLRTTMRRHMLAVLNFFPHYTPGPWARDEAELARTLRDYRSAGLRDAVVVFLHEPQVGGGQHEPAITPAEYRADYAALTPIARRYGYPVWTMLGGSHHDWQDWLPGDMRQVSGLGTDIYASAGAGVLADLFRPGNGQFWLAAHYGKKFGIGEMGLAAGNSRIPVPSVIGRFFATIREHILARPGMTAFANWWNGNPDNNLLWHPLARAGYRSFYSTLTGS